MSRSTRRRITTAGIAAAAIALGVAAEAVAYDWSDVSFWVPDLAAGWGLVALGLTARRVSPQSRCGGLVCAAGLAWFIGNFAVVDLPAIAWIGRHGAFLHRALLAHAVVGFPGGRLVSLLRRGVVTAAYVVVLWPALATSEAASMALGAAVLVVTVLNGPAAACAGVAFALAVVGVAADRRFLAPVDQTALLRFYEAALLLTGCVLVVALARWKSALADRVVELGEAATVRDAVRRVLGDPSLEVGFRRDGSYIDERGQPLESPSAPDRRVTTVAPSGEVLLFHDPAIPLDGSLAEAVSRTLRLTATNARLQAEALGQLAELRASRRRLALARGRQQALLARRLREGAELRLAGIEAALEDVEPTPAVAEAVQRVGAARDAIAALARGLQPPLLAAEGLAGALAALAASLPVDVSLRVDDRRFEAAVEHAAYLVCSEALANVVKHAGASEVELSVAARDGRLRLGIADNGCGGADSRGSGLRGIAERVEELGGTFHIETAPGDTRLEVEIPLRPDPAVRSPVGSERRIETVTAGMGT